MEKPQTRQKLGVKGSIKYQLGGIFWLSHPLNIVF